MTPTDPTWLLDLETGGRTVRAATRAASVTSTTDGATRDYSAGLGDLEVPDDADAVTVAIHLTDAAALRWRSGPWAGRRATLRLWYGGAWESAVVVLRGVVGTAEWDAPGAPDTATITIERAVVDLSAALLPAAATIDVGAWPSAYEDDVGAAVPLVIGRPGRVVALYGWTSSYPASPGHTVDVGILTRILAVACHPVAATSVDVWDLSDGVDVAPVPATVSTTIDGLGRSVATAEVNVIAFPTTSKALYAAWTTGGGVVFEGSEVRGLGTLIRWGATHRAGRHVYDLARIASEAPRLDRYQIDAVIDDPAIRWEEWLAAGPAESCLVERVEGPAGVYWREVATAPDPVAVRARLTLLRSAGGVLVVRESAYTDEELDAPGVVVRVWWAQHGANRWPQSVEYRPTAPAGDLRARPHPLCRRARELLGTEVPDEELPVREVYVHTADVATAWLVAQRHAERYALPAVVVVVSGPPDLGRRLEPHDTVELVCEDGTARLAVIEPGVTRSATRTTVRLRFAAG